MNRYPNIYRWLKLLGLLFVAASFVACKGGSDAKFEDAVDSRLDSIEIFPAIALIPLGTTQDYQAIAIYDDGSRENVTFDGSWSLTREPPILERYETGTDVNLGALDEFGTAIGVLEGTDELVFEYGGLRATSQVTVTETELLTITISPRNEQVPVGTLIPFTAYGVFTDGTNRDITKSVVWTSSDSRVATIRNTAPLRGVTQAISEGETRISASLNGISDETGLRVFSIPLKRLDVLPAKETIPAGGTQQYKAIAVYENGDTTDVTRDANWRSSDTNIATIEDTGLATGATEGTVTIEASFGGATGNASLTVDETVVLEELLVVPAASRIYPLQRLQLQAIAVYSDGSTRDVTTEATWSSSLTSSVVVSNSPFFGEGLAQGLAPGIATVSAELPGEPFSTAGSAVIQVLTVGGGIELVVSPSVETVVTGETQQYQAILVLVNGRKLDVTSYVTWTSDSPDIATVDGTGLAHGESPGDARIIARLPVPGTKLTDEASLTVRSSVTAESVVVTPPTATVLVGDSQSYTAVALLSNGEQVDVTDDVDWSTANGSIANILPGGLATGVAEGETDVIATLDTGEVRVQGNARIIVEPLVTVDAIVVSPPAATILEGDQQQYRAEARLSDGRTFDVTDIADWRSSDSTIAQVAPGGMASGIAAGMVTVTASIRLESETYQGTAELTVTAVTIENIQISPKRSVVLTGDSTRFTATAVLTDQTTRDVTDLVSWFVEDENVAAIESGNNAGRATGLSPGRTLVYVVYSQDGVTFSCLEEPICQATLEVVDPGVTGLSVTPAQERIIVGKTQQYTATATLENGDTLDVTDSVSWRSSNTDIASIDTSGIALGVTGGSVEISAILLDGDSIVRDTADLSVIPLPPTIQRIFVTPENQTILSGDTLQYTATAELSNGNSLDVSNLAAWLVTNGSIAHIDGGGLATGLSEGTVSVVANVNLGGVVYSGDTLLTVRDPVSVQSLEVTPKDASVLVGAEREYVATAVLSDGRTLDVTGESVWFTSNPGIALASQGADAGRVTGVSAGTVSVWVEYSFQGDAIACRGVPSCEAGLTVEAPLTVDTFEVLPAMQTVIVDTMAQFEARAILSDGSIVPLTKQASWTSDDAAVATPQNPEGLFIGVSPGTATITASFSYEGNNFEASATLVVEPVTVDRIEILPSTAQEFVGGLVGFNSIAYLSNGKAVFIQDGETWTSSNESTAIIDINTGVAQGLAVGFTTISLAWEYGGVVFTDTATMEVLAPAISGIEVVPHEIASRPDEQLRLFKDAGKDSGTEPPGHQYTAFATYLDGSIEDISESASWRSTNTTYANVTSSGFVTGTGEENDEGPDVEIQASSDNTTDGALVQMDGDCKPFDDKDFVIEEMEIQPRFNTITLRQSQSLLLQAVAFYRKDSAIFCTSVVTSDRLDDQPDKNRLRWSVVSGGGFISVDENTGEVTAGTQCGEGVVRATKERLLDSDNTAIYTADATVRVCVP